MKEGRQNKGGKKLNEREKIVFFIYFSDTLLILLEAFIVRSKSRLVM
jgi:hypothetical protein